MNTVTAKEVIVTTLTKRGDGTPKSPTRVIKQIWEKDGTLIAEVDPYKEPKADEERARLITAIKWALGEGDSNFGETKPDPAKPYWWRSELRRRAGL